MRRFNIASRILLILTISTFALAAPVLVQEERHAGVDVVHVPKGVITELGKRTREQDLDLLWGNLRYLRYWGRVGGNRNPAGIHLQEPAPAGNVPQVPAEAHVPPQGPAAEHAPPQNPADSNRESIDVEDGAPPGSPESGKSHSTPTSPEPESWYTPPPSLGSSTDSEWNSGSDSDSSRWSTISNAPSVGSLTENFNVANYDLKGKAKVQRRISGAVPPVVLTQ